MPFRLNYAIGYVLSFAGSLSMLLCLAFVIVPDCATIAVRSGGRASCAISVPAVFIFYAVFSLIIVFSGYRLAEILSRERAG